MQIDIFHAVTVPAHMLASVCTAITFSLAWISCHDSNSFLCAAWTTRLILRCDWLSVEISRLAKTCRWPLWWARISCTRQHALTDLERSRTTTWKVALYSNVAIFENNIGSYIILYDTKMLHLLLVCKIRTSSDAQTELNWYETTVLKHLVEMRGIDAAVARSRWVSLKSMWEWEFLSEIHVYGVGTGWCASWKQ